MNKKQIIVMWIGIAIIVLMGLFPPCTVWVQNTCNFVGYSFITNPKESRSIVELGRLIAQWVVVAALVTGIMITLNDQKNK